jgi:hypothetical protein
VTTKADIEHELFWMRVKYVAIVCALILMAAIQAAIVGLGRAPYVVVGFGATIGIISLLYYLASRNPARWGWLFGRRRRWFGSPYETRTDRNLTMAEVSDVARMNYEREAAMEHEMAPELVDGDLARARVQRIREFQKVERIEPGEKKLGEGVQECPQCGTAYAFDPDNRQCQACGTRLHDGKRKADR